MFYFSVWKRILDFQFTGENSPFWNLENVFPPKGAAKQNPYGVHLSILCFIRLVPGTVLERPISPSETKLSKCFIAWMDGWVGGWMDGL